MNYASLVNDMQLCADGGTAMDMLRFMRNLQTQLESSGTGVTAKTVKETMGQCFDARGSKTPSIWMTANYIPNVLKFLKALGKKGFAEAERLQGIHASAIFAHMKQTEDIEWDLVHPSPVVVMHGEF
jgi:hypothetical protein